MRAILTIGAAIWLAAAAPAAAQPAAAVTVETVDVRRIVDTTSAIGQLVASTDAAVAARRAGVVAEVLFSAGDAVAAGDPLVKLDTELTEIERRSAFAALDVAKAGVAAASARLAMASQTLLRQERLRGSTAFSGAQFEDLQQTVAEAQGELSRATAEVGSAEAAIARVDYDIEQAVVRAPFDGVIIERMAQPGQFVSLGDAVARLLDAAALEIEADVPSELIEGLPVGTPVDATFADGGVDVAIVRAVLPVETMATRTRAVRFSTDLSGVDPLLVAVGKSVTLAIPVSAMREATTVPKDALVQGPGGGWIVYVVEDGLAQPRSVTLGQAAGGRLEVLNGLVAGDRVVVRGNERLRPGQPVDAREAGG
ncbi:MAG: efflux RND transporter periplasmic adaptor subunit [Pseudomonadota bacterium]